MGQHESSSIVVSIFLQEESAKNLEISEYYLPLCFASFQFIRKNFKAIKNQ